MAIVGVILVTAVFGFILLGYLLKMYFGSDTKKYRLSLVGLGIFIIIFLVVFMIPLYMHMQEEGPRRHDPSSAPSNSKLINPPVYSYVNLYVPYN